MCARRFLAVIFMLTVLSVAVAFAIFQWGGNVLLKQATPVGHFEPAKAGDGPDYTRPRAWLDWPDPVHGTDTRWVPEGVAEPSATPAAATFYIHPTTYLQRDLWNAPLTHPESNARARLFVRSQATAFNSISEIWAPRYRQAAYGAFLLKGVDAQKALDLAYSDVRRAFGRFIEGRPTTQPIILAAHSQGSLHLSRLLADEKAKLKGRLVAAYVVGWPLSTTADLPSTGLPACTQPEQISCILSWQSFGEPANPDLILDAWVGTQGPGGLKRDRKDMLCVNPLTGTKDGSALPADNPGTLIPSADLASAGLTAGLVGARCADGFLLLSGAVPSLGPYVLPGNNYHVYDYALFWGAIRRDAERRLNAWQSR